MKNGICYQYSNEGFLNFKLQNVQNLKGIIYIYISKRMEEL